MPEIIRTEPILGEAHAPFAYSRPDGTVIADGFSSGEQATIAASLYQRAHGGDLRVWGRSIAGCEVGSPEYHWAPRPGEETDGNYTNRECSID